MLQIFPALWSIFIRWGEGRLGDNFLHHWQIIVGLFDCDNKHVRMVERATSGQCLLHMTYGDCINSGQQGKLNTNHFEKIFSLVASSIGKGQVLGVWDVRNCVKITKSPFLSPFTQKLELARARKHTKVNLMSK